jgi:hypothetical protein
MEIEIRMRILLSDDPAPDGDDDKGKLLYRSREKRAADDWQKI